MTGLPWSEVDLEHVLIRENDVHVDTVWRGEFHHDLVWICPVGYEAPSVADELAEGQDRAGDRQLVDLVKVDGHGLSIFRCGHPEHLVSESA